MAKHLRLINLKASEEEIAAWDAHARNTVHRNRSRWIRETLNAALPVHGRVILASPQVADKAREMTAKDNAHALLERVKETKAKGGACEKRLPKGTFCKSCGSIH